MGASDFYGTTSDDVYNYFDECEMNIYTLDDFVKNKKALSPKELSRLFIDEVEYYFVAKKRH